MDLFVKPNDQRELAHFGMARKGRKIQPIVRGPIKQVYLAYVASINASRTIGSFLGVVVDTYYRTRNMLSDIILHFLFL